jgi:DNA-binding SARP family transcriptional activator/Leucine-rich repeat (LRR) protein
MTRLSLTLLGAFQITLDGEPVTGFESDKVRALLVYLALEADRSHRRDALAEMLWPDRPEGVARNSLRQALANLRKAIGDREASPPFLRVTRGEVWFNPDSAHWLDVAACSALLAACHVHRHRRVETCEPCIRRLREAVALYRGPFLEQFYLGDSAAFEEWALVQRERMQRQAMKTLKHLTAYHERRGEYKEACEFARRQVELEPWNEAAQRELMRTLALSGQRSAALKQYQACRRVLADELGVEPAKQTTELFAQIRDGKYEPPEPPHKKKSAEISDSIKSQPFKLLALAMLFALILVLSLGLYVGSLDSNSKTGIVSENPSTPLATTVQDAEYQALVTLYNETGGLGWKDSSGWLSDSTPCSWFGVTCSKGTVTELDLHENGLSGSIPREIGLLTNLSVLNLEFNQLSGGIPPELGTLRRLNTLALDNNLFDGPIPPELGALTSLTSLDLRHNRLSGTLPPELGNLTRLVSLDISDNLISGSIPPQLGNLTNLKFISSGSNQLSGPLPAELGNLSNLVSLSLHSNKTLSGPIPPEIGRLSNLRLLDLNDNQFAGSLPSELGDLTELRELYINWNPLSGPLPMSLMNPNLEIFYFDGTGLCEPPDAAFQEWLDDIDELGRTGVLCQADAYSSSSQTGIPETEYQVLVTLYNETMGPGWKEADGWLSDFSPCAWFGVTCSEGTVTELALPDNDLSGSIPPEISQLTNLSLLDLGFNQLSGPIPPELGSLSALRHLILAGNTRLSGTIPPELGDLSKLEELILSSPSGQTQLTGSIPPQLGNLKRLMRLDLSNSMVSGPIPPELGNLTNLMFLDLSFNRLSGPLPPEMGDLSNLKTLILYGNNQLDGPIPPELGELVKLEQLILSNEHGGTKLSGPIPPELGNLRNLRRLDIDNCLVSGPIPPELGNLTDLTYLDLWRIPLSGPIPPELGNLVNLQTFSVGGIANELEGPLPLSLMNLKQLYYFTYGDLTNLCEPPDPAFQKWLNGIRQLDGPRVVCQSDG